MAQKYDLNSFVLATITIFSGENPTHVARRLTVRISGDLSCQSRRAFNAIHVSVIY